jgi:hypothetical protein
MSGPEIMENQFWAVAWAGPWEKGVWADSEQLFWVFFSIFHGPKKIFLNFFCIVASALKSSSALPTASDSNL